MQKSKITTRYRRGFGVIEVIVSVALMSLVLGMAVQMSSVMLRHRSAIAKQRSRAEAVSNLMEVSQSLPFDQLNAKSIEKLAAEVSDETWDIRVEETSQKVSNQTVNAKKISLQLKTRTKLDRLRAPLVAWRYPETSPISENATDDSATDDSATEDSVSDDTTPEDADGEQP